MSAETDIADAVANTIKTANLAGVAFADIKRTYLEDMTTNSADNARVTIIPGSFESATYSRSLRREMYGIDVVIQKRPADDAASDTAMGLIEQIKRLFEPAGKALAGYSQALWMGVVRSPIFDEERYDELRELAAVVRHQFVVYRST